MINWKDVELLKNGVRIEKEIYRIGEVLKAVDKNGTIQSEGKIEFKAYLDGEGYYDIYHLGFVVTGNPEQTLIDFLDNAKWKGWKIIKEQKEE
ncbi:MAG: hypothetical protein DRN78_04515 [Thermoproteota archaeon]|nr:MAG: hypothetical protein DRN78_04515 [Candidatus Korarchaeota archaeon]